MDRRHAGGGPLTREAASTANNIAIPSDTPSIQRRGTGRMVDYLEWRCRHGRCVDRPLHDCMDWWPAWALESRWSA